MKFTKPALSIEQQIQRLSARGLLIDDYYKAKIFLSNISFYRPRAYTYPFQNNQHSDHLFIKKVTLLQIIDLYDFDRKLRSLLFDALEKIEIAFRTQMIYQWSMTNGSHWHLDPKLFRNTFYFSKNLAKLQEEIAHGNETFLEHYAKKYTEPDSPPAWMSLEVSSLGLLSMMFLNLKPGTQKKNIVRHFGLYDVELMENWIRAFSEIRNICAHHSRLWNRRLTTHINFPQSPKYPFIKNTHVLPYKIYPAIVAVAYIIDIIDPENSLKTQIKQMVESCPLDQSKEMGFPDNWQLEIFWK